MFNNINFFILPMFQANPILGIIVIMFLGLILGSVATMVVYRLPIMMQVAWHKEFLHYPSSGFAKTKITDYEASLNLFFPASHCTKCHNKVPFYFNIPLLGYIISQGKCKYCKIKVPYYYFLIEIMVAFIALTLFLHYGWSIKLFLGLIYFWLLLVMSVIDLQWQLLPDDLTLPLLWIGLISSVLFPVYVNPQDAIIGSAIGYVSLWSVARLFYYLRGVEGMGYGDFKLLAAIGAWVGWKMLPLVILISAFSALFMAFIILAFNKKTNISDWSKLRIPFGPSLALAGSLSWLWYDKIYNLYQFLFI